MALVLPTPAGPVAALKTSKLAAPARAAALAHRRAQQRWQTGQEHAQHERWAQAAQAFEQASALHVDLAYALAAVHALIKAGQSTQAVLRAQRVRALDPRATLAYTLEAHALWGLGEAAAAVDCLRALPAEAARDQAHHAALAIGLQRSQRHGEAIRAFFDALALKMDDAVTHFRLGMSFKDLGMKAEAAECVRTALLLGGLGLSELAARAQLAFLEREACRWTEADAALAILRPAVRALAPDVAMETGPFPHAVLVGDPLEQLKVARHYAMHVARSVQPAPGRVAHAQPRAKAVSAADPHGHTRLRIGYLSADFHRHATSQLMVQMLESHDRHGFEVTLFSTGPNDHTPMRARIEAASEHFVELHGASFEAVAQRVRACEIDILVDLKGATFDTLLPVLAQRPAPLQVTWLGFPGSTGAPFIDYLIGDAIVTPLCDAAHFSEKIAQLPHCYQPNDAQRELPLASTRAHWGVGRAESVASVESVECGDAVAAAPPGCDDAILLCGFHQSYKISAEVFDCWCEFLHALPGAVLWLLRWNTNVQATLTAAAAARGIGPERLAFAPLLPFQEHLSRLACADIYLDAWPCNAHTTAGEALWVGVPVVTVLGAPFAQRVAASLLHSVALDELVCTDVAAYQRTVIALAGDPPRRAALHAHLLEQRRRSPLFDGAGFARRIEALYQRMWTRAVAGQAPEHLAAQE